MDKDSLSLACSTCQEMLADHANTQGQTINVTHREDVDMSAEVLLSQLTE